MLHKKGHPTASFTRVIVNSRR